MTMMNADLLDGNVLGIACMFYVLADLDNSIPLPNIKQEVIEDVIEGIKKGRKN
jgi:hypothetical protein